MKLSVLSLRRYSIALVFVSIFWSCTNNDAKMLVDDTIYEGIEFDMPKVLEPTFANLSVSIVDFGAVGDGQTLNSQAFADAIQAVSEKGGGRIVVPRGIWLTGPIVLKSNINIYTESGALVVFSKDKNQYPLVESNFEGLTTVRCLSPIYGKDLENIAFTGNGVFDGSGEAWRMVKRSKLTDSQWKALAASGGIVSDDGSKWYPSESYLQGEKGSNMNVPQNYTSLEDYIPIKDFLRPVMVNFINCNKILLDGPTFQNSPAWCIHPLMCENLTVRNIEVRNPWFSQNGDGIDIESCKNTILYNSRFDVGDDAICIKSGKDEDGRKRGMATENLIVKNCVVYHGHGGVTVGSEMSGGVKNMHVSKCTFIGTDVGLRFKSNRGRGGVVENIFISDIDMMNISTNAISFNLYYGGLSVSEMLEENEDGLRELETFEVSDETPQFKDISMKNITCKGARQAVYLQGLPEMNLENVRLENLTIEARKGLECIDANGITINGLKLILGEVPALTFYNAKNVTIENLDIKGEVKDQISVIGDLSKNISLTVNGEKMKLD